MLTVARDGVGLGVGMDGANVEQLVVTAGVHDHPPVDVVEGGQGVFDKQRSGHGVRVYF